MKNVITVLRHIISPLILCLFLILGFTAAMLSGVVEYHVIKELFPVKDAETYNFYIPLVIVIVLEGLKLFLHYIIPAHEQIGETKFLTVKKATKYVLIVFSLICTVIYVSNSLYTPEKVNSFINEKEIRIESKYEAKKKTEIKEMEKNEQIELSNAKIIVDNIENQLQILTPVYSPYWANKNYVEEKIRLENELESAKIEYEMKCNEIKSKYESEKKTIENDIEEEILKEKKSIVEDFNYISAGDNTYLSSALLFMVSVFGIKEYKRTMYYLCVLGISLIISVVLELAISFAQSYLALKREKLEQLFGEDEIIEETFKRKADRIIGISVQASIMLAVYLICHTLSLDTMNLPKNIFPVFVSYLLSIILSSEKFLPANNEYLYKEKDKKTYKTLIKVKNFTLPIVTQTLICIVGFILISIFLKNNLDNLIPTTIALSFGSLSGQIILKPKTI